MQTPLPCVLRMQKGRETMYELPDKLRSLIPYEPNTEPCAIRMDANESFFGSTTQWNMQVLEAALSVELNRYPDPYAEGVRRAFAEYYGYDLRLLTAGNGSDELISVISACFLEKGSRVLTFAPDFSMYAFYSSLYELQLTELPKNDALQIDVDEALRTIQELSVSAVLFSNPCNPTGNGLTREEILRLVGGTDALVIVDEAYMDFWDQSVADAVEEYDNLIVLRTCSKALGMAALRLGFAIANPRITRALTAAKSPYNVNAVTQAIAETLLSNYDDTLRERNQAIVASRDALHTELVKLAQRYPVIERVYDTKTNFVLLRLPKAKELAEKLRKRSIAVRAFEGFLRITAGTKEQNAAVVFALGKLLDGE